MTGQSTLALELVRHELQGKSFVRPATNTRRLQFARQRTAETVGGGAVIGTLLGAVIGGGKAPRLVRPLARGWWGCPGVTKDSRSGSFGNEMTYSRTTRGSQLLP